MRTILLLMGLMALFLLAGCAHKNPIIGTWVGTQTSPRGVTLLETWQFTDDGKNTTSMRVTSGPRTGLTVGSTGTYTASGSTLTQTIQTMSEPGRTVTVPRPVTATFQYVIKGDTLTINETGIGPLTLTRQAS